MTEQKPSKLKQILAAIGAVLVGLLLFMKSKNNTLEALNENNEALKEKAELDAEIAKNDALLNVEEVKRKEQVEGLKGNDEELSAKNLVDFFNRRK